MSLKRAGVEEMPPPRTSPIDSSVSAAASAEIIEKVVPEAEIDELPPPPPSPPAQGQDDVLRGCQPLPPPPTLSEDQEPLNSEHSQTDITHKLVEDVSVEKEISKAGTEELIENAVDSSHNVEETPQDISEVNKKVSKSTTPTSLPTEEHGSTDVLQREEHNNKHESSHDSKSESVTGLATNSNLFCFLL